MSLNTVNLTGNLVANASLHDSSSGAPYVKFSLAVNDRIYDRKTDQWSTYANFFDCAMFGARANHYLNDLLRGRKVSIKGRLRQNRWERDGKKYRRVEVIVEDLELMSATPYDQLPDDDLASEDFAF